MADKKRNPFRGIINYFKEVKSELKKVAWPHFKQIKNNTLIVLICILIIGAFIWILDAIGGVTLGRVINHAPQAETQQNLQAEDADASDQMNALFEQYGIHANEDGTYVGPEGQTLATQEEAMNLLSELAAAEDADADTQTDADTQADAE